MLLRMCDILKRKQTNGCRTVISLADDTRMSRDLFIALHTIEQLINQAVNEKQF